MDLELEIQGRITEVTHCRHWMHITDSHRVDIPVQALNLYFNGMSDCSTFTTLSELCSNASDCLSSQPTCPPIFLCAAR